MKTLPTELTVEIRKWWDDIYSQCDDLPAGDAYLITLQAILMKHWPQETNNAMRLPINNRKKGK